MPDDSHNNPKCNMDREVHQLNTRVSVVETKVDYIEEGLRDQKDSLERVEDAVDNIGKKIAVQNGTLPRIEGNMNHFLDRLTASEKRQASLSTKQKIIWAGLSAVVTGIILTILKMTIGV